MALSISPVGSLPFSNAHPNGVILSVIGVPSDLLTGLPTLGRRELSRFHDPHR